MAKEKNSPSKTITVTPEELQTQNDELAAKVTDLQASIDTLTVENTDLVLKVKTLSDELEKASKLTDELDQKLTDLSAKKDAPVISLPTVKVGKKNYQVAYPSVNFEGNVFSAEDLESNSDVCKALIEMGSGMLLEVAE